MASRERPLDGNEIASLLVLADAASDHMPFRVSERIRDGANIMFDRYLVRAMNEAPVLALEVQRLRAAIAKAVRSGRAHHEAEPREAPDLQFFLDMLRDLESELGVVT